MLSQSESSD